MHQENFYLKDINKNLSQMMDVFENGKQKDKVIETELFIQEN